MRRRREKGLTVVELAVALAGTAVVVGLVSMSTGTAFDTWQGTVATSEVELTADLAVDRFVEHLSDAALTTIADDLSAPSGGSSVTFQTRTGYAGGSVTLGPSTTIVWRSDAGDPRDDVDNDGDGLVDEGEVVVVTEGAGEVVLVRNVAEFHDGEDGADHDRNGNGLRGEQGLAFELDGRRLTVHLTLERKGADGERIACSRSAHVKLLD